MLAFLSSRIPIYNPYLSSFNIKQVHYLLVKFASSCTPLYKFARAWMWGVKDALGLIFEDLAWFELLYLKDFAISWRHCYIWRILLHMEALRWLMFWEVILGGFTTLIDILEGFCYTWRWLLLVGNFESVCLGWLLLIPWRSLALWSLSWLRGLTTFRPLSWRTTFRH